MTLEDFMPLIYVGLLFGAINSWLNYRLQKKWFKQYQKDKDDNK